MSTSKSSRKIESSNPKPNIQKDKSVYLFVYDIADTRWGAWFLKQFGRIKMVAHSSIVVYGKEFEYCDTGIYITRDGKDPGNPRVWKKVGFTSISQEEITKYVEEELTKKFKEENYSMESNNCWFFTSDLGEFLLGLGQKEILKELYKSFGEEYPKDADDNWTVTVYNRKK